MKAESIMKLFHSRYFYQTKPGGLGVGRWEEISYLNTASICPAARL